MLCFSFKSQKRWAKIKTLSSLWLKMNANSPMSHMEDVVSNRDQEKDRVIRWKKINKEVKKKEKRKKKMRRKEYSGELGKKEKHFSKNNKFKSFIIKIIRLWTGKRCFIFFWVLFWVCELWVQDGGWGRRGGAVGRAE